MSELFPTDLESIQKRLENIKPAAYCRNRNFIDGDVTRLSPYISRGVLSTRQIYQMLQDQGRDLKKIEKFIQELACGIIGKTFGLRNLMQ